MNHEPEIWSTFCFPLVNSDLFTAITTTTDYGKRQRGSQEMGAPENPAHHKKSMSHFRPG